VKIAYLLHLNMCTCTVAHDLSNGCWSGLPGSASGYCRSFNENATV